MKKKIVSLVAVACLTVLFGMTALAASYYCSTCNRQMVVAGEQYLSGWYEACSYGVPGCREYHMIMQYKYECPLGHNAVYVVADPVVTGHTICGH